MVTTNTKIVSLLFILAPNFVHAETWVGTNSSSGEACVVEVIEKQSQLLGELTKVNITLGADRWPTWSLNKSVLTGNAYTATGYENLTYGRLKKAIAVHFALPSETQNAANLVIKSSLVANYLGNEFPVSDTARTINCENLRRQ